MAISSPQRATLHFLTRSNLSLPIYQYLKDVSIEVLFAERNLEIFLSVLAAGIPLLGCVSLSLF